MRWDASELGAPGFANAAASVGDGGATGAEFPLPRRRTPSAIGAAIALPERRTGRLVEEVEVLRVDRDRNVGAKLELDGGGGGCDQVRPGADDRLLRVGLEGFFLLAGLALQAAGVDLEVRHRLAA